MGHYASEVGPLGAIYEARRAADERARSLPRYRVSCAGEDALGRLPKGGYYDDLDEAIVRADYAGACVTDLVTGESVGPERWRDHWDAEDRLIRKRVLAAAGLPPDHAFAPAPAKQVPDHVRDRYRAGAY